MGMQDTQTPVDRETLYEEVWADPVKVVAQRYGISDVGLAKICKKLSIPIPSRGYWAKVKAGKIMRKIPLPALPPGATALTGTKPLSRIQREAQVAVQKSVAKIIEDHPVIDVPEELTDPHPLVSAAEKRLKQRDGWDDVAGLRSAPKEVLHVEVTRASL